MTRASHTVAMNMVLWAHQRNGTRRRSL